MNKATLRLILRLKDLLELHTYAVQKNPGEAHFRPCCNGEWDHKETCRVAIAVNEANVVYAHYKDE